MDLHNSGNEDLLITGIDSTLPLIFYPVALEANVPLVFPLMIHPGDTYLLNLYYDAETNHGVSSVATLAITSNMSPINISLAGSPLSSPMMSATPSTDQHLRYVGGCALSEEKTDDASLLVSVGLVSLFWVAHYFTKTAKKLT